MTTVQSERHRRYVRRLRARLKANRKDRCLACRIREILISGRLLVRLEFAHRRSTGLNGEGRGSARRMLDIQKHPRAYALLCKPCHIFFDRGILRPPNTHTGEGWRCRVLSEDEMLGAFAPLPKQLGEEDDVHPLLEVEKAVEAQWRAEAREVFARPPWQG